MIEKAPFGRTGHESSRILFGAAALAAMRQEKADQILEVLLEYGVNHIDTAASYGDSELRLASWLARHRDRFFLATKTGERTYEGAKASLHRSLERMQVDRVDLIQLHNLVAEADWQTAFSSGGALKALVEARDQGLIRFIGITGHGTRVAEMHRRSLEQFPFDSVLLPYNFTMMSQSQYASDFERLLAVCQERGVAVQTIKSIARRNWSDDPHHHFSWYEPLRDEEAVRRAVHFVLSRPGIFLNTSSDATLLRLILSCATNVASPSPTDLEADVARFDMKPLFLPGVPDPI